MDLMMDTKRIKKREYLRKWREQNPDKVKQHILNGKEYNRGWRKQNPDKVKAYSKEEYKKIKADPKCMERKRKRERVYSATYIVRNKEFIKRILSKNSCVDCGYSDIRALEFDHVLGKKLSSISDLVCRGKSMKRIKTEIRKTEIRCCNCHRIKSRETHWATCVPKPPPKKEPGIEPGSPEIDMQAMGG